MSLIFLSHSSVDELEAVALKQWLLDNGWDDVFLDLDPERGLRAGERWQEALKRSKALGYVVERWQAEERHMNDRRDQRETGKLRTRQ